MRASRKLIMAYRLSFSFGQRRILEDLWREFFADTSQWWDHRSEKVNPRYPDFKHKTRQQSLWLNDASKPPWVEEGLAAMSPGSLQCSLFSWNKRLARYVKAGAHERTMDLFRQMQGEGVNPDKFTFIPVLNACSSLRELEEGRRIHTQIMKCGCESDVFVGNCLIDMYAKCGSIEDAWRVFDEMPVRDVVSWNAMILGYVKCGQGQMALTLSRRMRVEGLEPDPITFVGLVNACAAIRALEEGRRFHEQIIMRGYESDIYVGSSLVDMYAKCGSVENAWRVFTNMPKRNEVAWSSMILGYVQRGLGEEALRLFGQMHREGLEPNCATFIGVLKACTIVAAIDEGRRIHDQIMQRGLESHVYVASSLVDMYTKCGSIEEAQRVFNKMPARDVVAWTAMILGHVKSGDGQKALELFRLMQGEGVDPDPITFVGLLNACASVAALEEGRRVHEQVRRSDWETDLFVGSSLIDMYAKCGSMEDARKVFNNMPTHNVVSWNAMLGGYAMHGHPKEALGLFESMSQEVIDGFTFTSLLSACSHGGLVNEGLHYFESMSLVFGVSPTEEHYTCAVDLLGRAGLLHEAEDLINTMPQKPSATVWRSLLGACRLHGSLELGKGIAHQILELDPEDATGYLLLSNMHAASGKLGRIADIGIHERRLDRGVKK